MFLERSASLRVSPSSSTARTVIEVIGAVDLVAVERPVGERIGGVPGLLQVPLRERVLVHDDRAALLDRAELGLQAAGFIATRTFGWSPGVRMSVEANWIWNAETPWTVLLGPDLGREVRHRREIVAQDRRGIGEAVSCIPSPESPANRIDALLLLDLLGHRRRAWPGRLLRLGS